MPVLTVVCPTCRSFLQLPQAVPVGQPIRCRICSSTFLSGSGATKEADPPEPEKRPAPVKPKRPRRKEEVAVEPGGEDRAWQRLQQQQRRRLLIQSLAIVGGLVLLIGGVALIASFSSGPEKQQQKKENTDSTHPADQQPPPGQPEDTDPLQPSRRTEEEEPSRPPTKRTEEEDPLRAPPLLPKPKVDDP